MAIAVSNAGGLGSIAAAMLSSQGLKAELEAVSAGTSHPFNVNFFAHVPPQPDQAREARWRSALAPFYEDYGIDPAQIQPGAGRQPFTHEVADVVEPFRPAVVSFHFGLPKSELLQRVKRWGSIVLGSATTVDEARWLVANGADAVIAQGIEAGGHRGHFLTADLDVQMGTMALLPQVVAAVPVPVIAAGGIADVTGIRAALAMGAAAVQLGTAFLLTDEATTSSPHREALRRPDEHYTALTNLFSGRPARGIVNRVMQELGPMSGDVPEFPLASTALAPLRAKAEAAGKGDFSPLWAGQNFRSLREVGAAELVRQLETAF